MSISFPKVFVINLEKRVDRWTKIQQVCETVNITPIQIPAVELIPGWHGCGLSHLKCIQIAKDLNLPWILILEDDATFTIESILRFKELLPYLWNNQDKWGRFNGGPTFNNRRPDITILNIESKLLYVNGLMAHFNLINSTAFDLILQWNPIKNREIDTFLMKIRSVATFPHISIQIPSISNIQRPSYVTDYKALFQLSEKMIREKFELNN